MEDAHPAANAALGKASLVGNLGGRGVGWLLVPALLLSCVFMALPGFFLYVLAVVLFIGLVATLAWMHRASLVYSIHPQGLAIQRGWRFLPYFGTRVELFRWDEIAAVYRRIVSRYAITSGERRDNPDDDEHHFIDLLFCYEIVSRDGRRAVLDSRFGDVMEAGDFIAGEVKRRLLPDLLAQFDRGEKVAFGPVTVRRDGLTFGQRDYDWSTATGFDVQRGMLVLECNGAQPSRVSLASIPNLALLFALLAERQPDVWVAANPARFAEQKRVWSGPRMSR